MTTPKEELLTSFSIGLELYQPKKESLHYGKRLLLLLPTAEEDKEKPLFWRYGISVALPTGAVRKEYVASDYVESHFVREEITASSKHVKTKKPTDKCPFVIAWHGRCKQPVVNSAERCETHQPVGCEICGELATHECSFSGQFVCGSPLCDNEDCYENHGRKRRHF